MRFLEAQTTVGTLIADIAQFMTARIPEYQASNRGYLTVAVGCTGGQHRSVYIVERLAEIFAAPLLQRECPAQLTDGSKPASAFGLGPAPAGGRSDFE